MGDKITHYTYVDKVVNTNEEFISSKIKELHPNWLDSSCKAKKVDIRVDKDMEVKINGTDIVRIKAEYGLTIEYDDVDIKSIVALTDNVRVYAIIGY